MRMTPSRRGQVWFRCVLAFARFFASGAIQAADAKIANEDSQPCCDYAAKNEKETETIAPATAAGAATESTAIGSAQSAAGQSTGMISTNINLDHIPQSALLPVETLPQAHMLPVAKPDETRPASTGMPQEKQKQDAKDVSEPNVHHAATNIVSESFMKESMTVGKQPSMAAACQAARSMLFGGKQEGAEVEEACVAYEETEPMKTYPCKLEDVVNLPPEKSPPSAWAATCTRTASDAQSFATKPEKAPSVVESSGPVGPPPGSSASSTATGNVQPASSPMSTRTRLQEASPPTAFMELGPQIKRRLRGGYNLYHLQRTTTSIREAEKI
ncbi:unnamed protein product [Amoebophrya sp. A120]|nr:unnamed protein product [Amoebophrya sp. A120]|eukprot:GSA120T00020250001.1